MREFYKSRRFSQKDGSIQIPFEVDQHHSQKAKKDLHKAKVEFTLGEKEAQKAEKHLHKAKKDLHKAKKDLHKERNPEVSTFSVAHCPWA